MRSIFSMIKAKFHAQYISSTNLESLMNIGRNPKVARKLPKFPNNQKPRVADPGKHFPDPT